MKKYFYSAFKDTSSSAVAVTTHHLQEDPQMSNCEHFTDERERFLESVKSLP